MKKKSINLEQFLESTSSLIGQELSSKVVFNSVIGMPRFINVFITQL